MVAPLASEHEVYSVQASQAAAHDLSCPVACGILVPGLGIEPVSPVLAGGFLTSGPQGKSPKYVFVNAASNIPPSAPLSEFYSACLP